MYSTFACLYLYLCGIGKEPSYIIIGYDFSCKEHTKIHLSISVLDCERGESFAGSRIKLKIANQVEGKIMAFSAK